MSLRMIVMDAGQGEAILLVYPNGEAVLVDCGCQKNKGIVNPQIQNVIDKCVKSKKLKALVLTHPDSDHYNLVKQCVLDKNFEVEKLLYGGHADDYGTLSTWIKLMEKNGRVIQLPKPKDIFPTQICAELSYSPIMGADVNVRILAANCIGSSGNYNDNSVVFMVSYGDINIFLTGDATIKTESFILENDHDNGDEIANIVKNGRSVLKLGHHGSNSSSSEEWLAFVRPQVVFISSDTRTFGGVSVPRSSVIERIKAGKTVLDFGKSHYYVQYNDSTDVHEAVETTLGIYSTLSFLKLTSPTEFTSYGASYYYIVEENGEVLIEWTGTDD